ncbi:alpha/beta hydrolase [soil metagenome]
MKKLLLLFAILVIASCKKEEFNPELTREFSILSNTNGGNYTIKVALPEDYTPTKKYATLYVLDGEENFAFVAIHCKNLSKEYGTTNILVVSIGYGKDRADDYTPTVTNEGKGGAEKFMEFITGQLIPKMENDFSADTSRKSRVILGHSFGGLFAAYAFANHNSVFGSYLMLSPSIWYDNEIILRLEENNRPANKENQQLVFMGLGELENEGRMLAPYMALYQRLKNNYPLINIASHLEPHVDHNGSKKPNILQGLKFYFQHN